MSARYPEPFWLGWIPGGRMGYRFMTGRPLDGIRRTDAIFQRPGVKSMDPSGYAHPWHKLAGYQRLLIRLILLYVGAWCALVLITAPFRWLGMEWADKYAWRTVLTVHVVGVLVVGVPVLSVLLVRWFGIRIPVPVIIRSGRRLSIDGWVSMSIEGTWTWDRNYVRPVVQAMDSVLGTRTPKSKARRLASVPRTFRDPESPEPVCLTLPSSFVPDVGTQRRLVAAVSSRLGMSDPQVTWLLEGPDQQLRLQAAGIPPTLITYPEVRRYFEETEEFRIFVGMRSRTSAVYVHMKGDSPHLALSAASDSGKSEFIKLMIMQALRWGWGVVVLDWKEVSQEWCDGLPGVQYLTDVAAIHDACVRIGEEVEIRKSAYRRDKKAGNDPLADRSKVLVVCEEMNITGPLLMRYWQELRGTSEPDEKRVMPVRSPAMSGLESLNFAGRQLGLFQVFVAQRFTARTTGGNADMRESFAALFMAKWKPSTWKMLAPHIKPMPPIITNKGGWMCIIGSDAVRIQAPLVTDTEAQEYARGGERNPHHPYAVDRATQRPNVGGTQGEPLGHNPAVPGQRQALEGEICTTLDARKLSDMVDMLSHLGVTLEILRNAVKRDSSFPGPVGGDQFKGYTYDVGSVKEWARKRLAARKATS